jgi:N-acyl homoserine lactone hydrolase
MKMHALSGGRLRLKKSIYFPDADRAETIDVPVSCFLIRHKQGNVLFDSGCHPSVIDDAQGRWGGVARLMTPTFSHDQSLIAQLKSVGVGPEDIDVVINSHFHPDHCGCNAFFTRATIVCHALELEAAKAANAGVMGYVPADWDHPMTFDTVEGQRDLYGDDRIVVIPLPGHSLISTGPARSCWHPTRSASAPTTIATSCRAIPGTPSRWTGRSRKSGASKPVGPRWCAGTMKRNGSSSGRATMPMRSAECRP